ncbi:hypothetical protein ES708_13317 [subsurface metagenome]
MPKIADPVEFWDMADGDVRTVRVVRHEEGWTYIVPRYNGAPERKRINVMRLHLTEDSKPHLPYYWDITSGHLMVGLRPHLARADLADLEFTIQKFGVAPRARFSLAVSKVEE